jgi:hypothetical protein
MVKVFFNDEIKPAIISCIANAKNEMFICMAWLTDNEIMEAILDALKKGVNVELLLLDTVGNIRRGAARTPDLIEDLKNYKVRLDTFCENRGSLLTIPEAEDNIHHKFCVIDKAIVMTGSYNWSYGATYKRENLVVIEDDSIAQKYIEEFQDIKNKKELLILSLNYPQCSNCNHPKVVIKVVDYRSTSRYYQNETYALEICIDNPAEHIIKKTENTESDFYGEMIHSEWDSFENAEDESKNFNNLFQRHIDHIIANDLNSRVDSFVQNGSHEMLGLYKITRDMEGFDLLSPMWEHSLIKGLGISDYENEIIEFIDAW